MAAKKRSIFLNKISFLTQFHSLLCLWSMGQVKVLYEIIIAVQTQVSNNKLNLETLEKLLIATRATVSERAQ